MMTLPQHVRKAEDIRHPMRPHTISLFIATLLAASSFATAQTPDTPPTDPNIITPSQLAYAETVFDEAMQGYSFAHPTDNLGIFLQAAGLRCLQRNRNRQGGTATSSVSIVQSVDPAFVTLTLAPPAAK